MVWDGVQERGQVNICLVFLIVMFFCRLRGRVSGYLYCMFALHILFVEMASHDKDLTDGLKRSVFALIECGYELDD